MEAGAKRAPIEPASSLWSEALLIGAGVAIGAAGLFTLAMVQGQWPRWYGLVAGLALAPWTLKRRLPLWAPLAGAAALASPGMLIREWRWWLPGLAAAIAGTLAFCAAAAMIVLHHRSMLERAIGLLEWATQQDWNGDGQIERPAAPHPTPMRIVYSNLAPPAVEDARYEMETPDLAEEMDRWDRQDFGYFVARLWPTEPEAYRIGSSSREWEQHVMPSGVKLGRSRWREYCERLVRAGLARRANEASNAPYVLRATRVQALRALQQAIILPEAQAEGAGDGR